MDANETYVAMHELQSFFPYPAPLDGENLAWAGIFEHYTMDEFREALELVANNPDPRIGDRRPAPASFQVVLRSVHNRRLTAFSDERGLPAEPVAQHPLDWIAQGRQELAAAAQRVAALGR